MVDLPQRLWAVGKSRDRNTGLWAGRQERQEVFTGERSRPLKLSRTIPPLRPALPVWSDIEGILFGPFARFGSYEERDFQSWWFRN